jgi:O-antigen/teichoic acid export membrane protein
MAMLCVGLVALPILLHALGAAKLGVFTLALGLIGFSGLLDLGLGRALTQGVSSALGIGRPRDAVAALVWHVLRLLGWFGVFWLVVLWLLVPLAVQNLFNLSGELAKETILGLRVVALSMPFSLVATGAMGALEGLQQFRRVSTQRSLLSVVQFGLPTVLAVCYPNVGWVISGLVASRVLGVVVWLNTLSRVLPRPQDLRHSSDDLRHLLRFGGWLSISNLVGPLMVYADRFYLAALFPPAAVAIYTVPYDALFRLTSITNTAIAAVFPALAEARTQHENAKKLVRAAAIALIAVALPPALFAVIFAGPLLTLWFGKSFAVEILRVFQILVLGVFVNGLAQVPYALLQAYGRSDVTAKLHLAELPFFAALLVWTVSRFGIYGAALTWTLRVVLDTVLLYVGAVLLHPELRKLLLGTAGLALLAGIAILLPMLSANLLLVIPLSVTVCAVCTALLVRMYLQWRGLARARTRICSMLPGLWGTRPGVALFQLDRSSIRCGPGRMDVISLRRLQVCLARPSAESGGNWQSL